MTRRQPRDRSAAKVRVSRADCRLLARALSAAGESDTFESDEDQRALNEAHELLETTLARTGPLWLTVTATTVDALIYVVDFVSESESFESDDAALDWLWRALREADTKIDREG